MIDNNYKDISQIVTRNGKFYLPSKDIAGEYLKQAGYYSFKERIIHNSNLFSNIDTMFDLGAHVGTFSIPLLLHKNINRVYGIEANPKTFELLMKNIKYNCLEDRFIGINGVVYDDVEQGFQISIPDERLNGKAKYSSATYKAILDDKSKQMNTIIYIDDLDYEGKLDFVKMDIEGCEMNALLSMEKTIMREFPIFYIEISGENLQEYGHTPIDIEEFLRDMGYTNFYANVPNYKDKTSKMIEISTLIDGPKGDIRRGDYVFFDVLVLKDREWREYES